MPQSTSGQSATQGAVKAQKIAFVASQSPEAQTAFTRLNKRYGGVDPQDADVIVALGGDGIMLQTLHHYMGSAIPIYGMNRGSIGFLMNEYREKDVLERISEAKLNVLHPLKMTVYDTNADVQEALAINEVHLFRLTNQAARLKISVDEQERVDELVCDGVLVSTPAGSTAYNLSVGGPILPLKAKLLALTPISPFRPRRWRGALLPNKARVQIEVLEHEKRPVSAVADHREIRNVRSVHVREDRNFGLKLLFDPGHALEERIVAEQFRF